MSYLVSVIGYGTNTLQLSLTRLIIPSSGNAINLTGNAKKLADYLNSLRFNPTYQPILISLAALDSGPLNAALSSINPVRSTINNFAASNTMFRFTSFINARMNMQKSMKQLAQRSEREAIISLFKKEPLLAADDTMLTDMLSSRRICKMIRELYLTAVR